MKPVSVFLAVLYWTALIFDCILISSHNTEFRYVTKLVLMPLLFGIMVSEIERTTKWWSIRIMSVALLFSLIGDALLIDPGNLVTFMLGIFCFFIVQICYISFFYRKRPFLKKDATFLTFATIAILAYVILMQYLMWEKLYDKNLYIPIIIYSLTIGFMLLTAANLSTSHRLRDTAVMFFIPGAVLFVISDSLIALNKFYFSKPTSDVYIMFTYAFAQFLIMLGAIRVIRKK